MTSFSSNEARRTVIDDPSTEQISGSPAIRSQSGSKLNVVLGRISVSRFDAERSTSATCEAIARTKRVKRGVRFLRPRAPGWQQRVNLLAVGVAVYGLNHQLVVKLTVPSVVICVACTVTSATGEVSS